MNKKYIYIAGPLFSENDLNFNTRIGSFLRNALDDRWEVFIPQEFNINKDQIEVDESLTKDETIAQHDLECIQKSNVLVINLDNLDPGTFTELGYFFKKLEDEKDIFIFGLYSDWRKWLNKFVSGMFLNHKNAFLCKNELELKETILKYVKQELF